MSLSERCAKRCAGNMEVMQSRVIAVLAPTPPSTTSPSTSPTTTTGSPEKTGLKFRTLTTPGTTVKQIFVRDPNGVTIELNWKGERPRG